jgi:hypothetical protein
VLRHNVDLPLHLYRKICYEIHPCSKLRSDNMWLTFKRRHRGEKERRMLV